MPPLEQVSVSSPEIVERHIFSGSSKNDEIGVAYCPKLSPIANSCAQRYQRHRHRYEAVIRRAGELVHYVSDALCSTDSNTLLACRSTVLNELSDVLRRTTSIFENFVCERDDEARANVALDWAEKYLSHIESTIARDDIECLDAQLRTLKLALGNRSHVSSDNFSCGVSLARTSDLVFDLGLGPASFSRTGSSVMAQAMPVAMVSARRLLEQKGSENLVQPYKVEVVSSESKGNIFPATSERTGEAHITIKVTPFGDNGKGAQLIKGVRVSQTNACTPRSDMVADLFTSYTEGETGFTIRLVVNSFRTNHGAAPHFKVQIVLPTAH